MSHDTTATPPKNIQQRVLAVMEAVPYVQKVQRKTGMQYTFVNRDAVISKLRVAMIQHGIVYFPSLEAYNIDGNRITVQVAHTYANADDRADCIVFANVAYGIDPQDKGPGKAMTYAEKMAHLKLFMIEAGDEDECERYDEPQKPATATKQPKATQPKADAVNDPDPGAKFKEVRKSTGMSNDDIMAALGDGFKALDDKGKCDALYLLERKFSAKQDIADHIEKYKIDAATFDIICANAKWFDPWHKNPLAVIEEVANELYAKGEE
jgi:hypothetical protein